MVCVLAISTSAVGPDLQPFLRNFIIAVVKSSEATVLRRNVKSAYRTRQKKKKKNYNRHETTYHARLRKQSRSGLLAQSVRRPSTAVPHKGRTNLGKKSSEQPARISNRHSVDEHTTPCTAKQMFTTFCFVRVMPRFSTAASRSIRHFGRSILTKLSYVDPLNRRPSNVFCDHPNLDRHANVPSAFVAKKKMCLGKKANCTARTVVGIKCSRRFAPNLK